MARVLVIDNYDSFVYNLVQYLGELGAEPIVRRPADIDPAGLADLAPDGLLISPGPGRPEEATTALRLLYAAAGRIPVLGVCLGHQCIAVAYGAEVVRVPVMHGKTSEITHDGLGVFAALPDPLVATRYHSLAIEGGASSGADVDGAPDLGVTAWAGDGTIMGIRHRHLAVEGVQFHPESILTDGGHRLVANWLESCGQAGAIVAAGPAADRQRLPA
ncbi:MAG: aminodeoxychorismate/anthranilate synthase component II [Actinomycetota bacterium]|nr:aminodeoxychorismate/anthranilate synthase component II [Actinomycetota bacterium]